ncbi:MAG: error-prone DNA polymerase [Burkholderiales bacterium PBB4]|nr:MAG: error-prone DNA polymerase [Burkholderiales bacterium PBB4]
MRRGYTALAITDECSLSGVVRAHEEAQQRGLHLIIGAQMALSPAKGGDGVVLAGHAPPQLLLLAQARRGYGNLAQWISVARRRAAKGQYLAHPSDLEGRVPSAPHLAGLPDCFAILLPGAGQSFETVFAHAMWLKTWFGAERCAIAIELLHRPLDAWWLELLPRVAALTGLPLVACGDVLMHRRSRKPLLDVLAATRLGQPVAACGLALASNAEAHLRSRERLAQLYAPAWLAATLRIAASCTFSLAELRYEYPQEIVPEGHTPTSWLRQLTEQGVLRRYPEGTPVKVRTSIEHELALIAQLRYEPYFLTVADIVHWARSQRILCQGRGSAANSTVCFCLGVTEVDPARTQLLFERFISAERNEPPDIDLDFEHQRREEVIQYLYAKYGRQRAALTGVVISYRPRSALRDVGRALGLDIDRINAVSRGQQWWDGGGIATERLREQGFDPDAPVCRQWIALTQQLIGFPRHLSQHPGGFVIARDDIARLVPVENASMPGRTVIQWDKDDLDALGLIKVDILALGMLSAIRRALDLVATKLLGPLPAAMLGPLPAPAAPDQPPGALALPPPPRLGMQQLPPDDTATFDMLCRGDSIGTFQVESRAQISMLPRLQPRKFYDLVIEVAIVRPGPIQGGMVHPYLRRRSGQEPVSYPSAEVKQALERTLGVPIFQEQVMQLAILAADFTPGEADSLRRAMAAWKRKGGLGPFHERLVGRMVAKGYTAEYAESIFRQIQGFGEYGFPESHAASFALLVYISCYLKWHEPACFLAALLNSQPLGFYGPAQLVQDALRHGVQVRAVDVVHSDWDCTLEPASVRPEPPVLSSVEGPAIRLGLRLVSGLTKVVGERIAQARQHAPFVSTQDLALRCQLDAGDLKALASADALQSLSGHRRQQVWEASALKPAPALLQGVPIDEEALRLSAAGEGEEVTFDYAAVGLTLRSHPLLLLRDQLAKKKLLTASQMRDYPSGRLVRACGIVTMRQRPQTAKGVVFVTLEDETGSVNVIVWKSVREQFRQTVYQARLMAVYGIWQRDEQSGGEVRHVVAKRLVDLTPLLGELATTSRDFH